ncbi:MAG: putative phage abortive infection protein [Sulfitobacter geojensis]
MKQDSKPSQLLWLLYALGAFTIVTLLVTEVQVCPKDEDCGSLLGKFKQLPLNGMGDALAGVFGSLAFFAAAVAVALQSVELRAQRVEFEKMNGSMLTQQFETAFFELIRTHSEIVAQIDINRKGGGEKIAEGRDCFVLFYREFNKSYRAKLAKHDERIALYFAYKDFWNKRGSELGHYYRFLFNSFRMISNAKTSGQFREHHAKLLRSQLSDTELLLLYYNCLSLHGKDFVTYAVEFELFDNLPTLKLLNQGHINLVPASAFGDNPLLTRSMNKKQETEHLKELAAITGEVHSR